MDRAYGDPHQVFKFPRFVAIATIHSPGRVRSKTCLYLSENADFTPSLQRNLDILHAYDKKYGPKSMRKIECEKKNNRADRHTSRAP